MAIVTTDSKNYSDIAEAIRNKGVSGSFKPNQMAAAIEQIEGGGGGGNPTAPENDVIFIDFDGTIRYSYTKEEFLALTELPPNPNHSDEGLVSEGWNWTFAGAQSYVRMYDELVIGQTYHALDNKCHVILQIPENDLTFTANVLGYKGVSVTVDFGDGSELITKTAEKSNATLTFEHTYARGGVHEVIVDASGRGYQISNFFGGASTYDKIGQLKRIVHSPLAGFQTISPISLRYMGDCEVIFPRGIYNVSTGTMCSNLIPTIIFPLGYTPTAGNSNWWSDNTVVKYVSFPEGFDGVYRNYNFSGARSIRKVCPDTTNTAIANNVVANCKGLSRIVIPVQTTSIGAQFASGCTNVKTIKFYPTTPPAVANANAFNGVPTSCKIYVPRGCLSAYTTATNYPDSATYTYEEFDIPT